jgi:hypothetical protein
MMANIPISLPPLENVQSIMVKIKIMKAIMLKDIETFGKMDPYCEVYLKPAL